MAKDKNKRASEPLHDAHVRSFQDWHGPLPSEILNARNAVRARDFKPQISAVIRDFDWKRPMPANEMIDGIDAALNEYHALKTVRDEQTKTVARQRGNARNALAQIQKQLNKATANPILAREIIAAFSTDLHEKLRHEIARASDAQLTDGEQTAALQYATQHEAEISAIAQRIGQAIDNLEMPENPGGRPAEPELDRLIARLAGIVVWGVGRNLTDGEVSEFAAPLMAAGRVPRALYTIECRLRELDGRRYFSVPLTETQQASLPIHDL